jgi:hypothetical protein
MPTLVRGYLFTHCTAGILLNPVFEDLRTPKVPNRRQTIFITFINDPTRFCYVYLLKSKDEALHYFKTYKVEVENQLERKFKLLRSDRGGEYFAGDFLISVWNMVLFMRGHCHTHHNPMGLLRERTLL